MLIELSGTPSSGKESIIEGLRSSTRFKSFEVIEADKIAEDRFDFDIHNYELRILWRIFDTYLKTTRIILDRGFCSPDLLILNRGLFDRIAWARLLSSENRDYAAVARDIEKNLRAHELLHKIDVVFLVLTSYDKVKERREKNGLGANEVFVNPRIIATLNEIYLALYEELKNDLQIVKLDDLNEDLSLEEKLSVVISYVVG